MDRPTTGKRRVRTGSVHVNELIGRKHLALDPDEIRVEPLEPTPHRPAPPARPPWPRSRCWAWPR
ncbi:hypothetical protein [Actinokineospora sp. HUAS TT18]|uniref:hypothetical protein n=1 Tax=Actinokineospora sp. HUAS TT18 TaxID=3447451 RepID=UPI003F52510C